MLIEIEQEVLSRVCDAALRSSGLNALIDVNKIMFAANKATAISNSEIAAKKEKEKKDGSTISSDDAKLAK